MIGAVLSVALPLLTGFAARRALGSPERFTFPGLIGACYLLGVAINGSVSFLLGASRVPLNAVTFASIPAIAIVAIFLRKPKVSASPVAHPRAATVLLIAPFAFALIASAIVPLTDYDGIVTWQRKAKAIALEESITGPFFHGERGLNLHNHYPLLIPMASAQVMRLAGRVDDHETRWLYVLMPFAALLAARDLLHDKAAAWICAGVAWLPQMIAAPEGGVFSAYSDLAIAAFLGMSVLALNANEPAGVWLAALILTKNEGLLLAAAAIAIGIAFKRLRRSDVLLVVTAIGTLMLWRWQVPNAYDENYTLLVRDLPAQLHRIDDAVLALGRAAFDFRHWGLFWPAVMAAVGACIARRERSSIIPIAALCAAFAAYVLAFTVTSWNVDALAAVSANRLCVQTVVVAAPVLLHGWRTVMRRTALP